MKTINKSKNAVIKLENHSDIFKYDSKFIIQFQNYYVPLLIYFVPIINFVLHTILLKNFIYGRMQNRSFGYNFYRKITFWLGLLNILFITAFIVFIIILVLYKWVFSKFQEDQSLIPFIITIFIGLTIVIFFIISILQGVFLIFFKKKILKKSFSKFWLKYNVDLLYLRTLDLDFPSLKDNLKFMENLPKSLFGNLNWSNIFMLKQSKFIINKSSKVESQYEANYNSRKFSVNSQSYNNFWLLTANYFLGLILGWINFNLPEQILKFKKIFWMGFGIELVLWVILFYLLFGLPNTIVSNFLIVLIPSLAIFTIFKIAKNIWLNRYITNLIFLKAQDFKNSKK